jgi:hypothetical protein
MFDYEVIYKGTSIGYIKADTDRKALNLARKIYGPEVTAKKV